MHGIPYGCANRMNLWFQEQTLFPCCVLVSMSEAAMLSRTWSTQLDIAGHMPTIEGDMPTKNLAETLFPRARLAVLAKLTGAGNTGLHLREIARRAGLNSKTVMRELHALRDAGILLSKNVGRQVIYRLNPDCPIYEELRAIIRKTVGLADVLKDAMAPLSDRIDLAYIFGSHASGEESVESDVDLMIVGEVSLREVSAPLRGARGILRRQINPTLYRAEEYRLALAEENSFVRRVHDGSRIEIIGGDR